MPTCDVIVLGCGGVGSAALMHLAKRGARVVGLDRFCPPHAHGSSHGDTRVIRQAYFEHPDYVPLLLESYRLWEALEEETGTHLYYQTGLLEVGPRDGEVVPGVLRAAREHQLSVDELDSTEVAARCPGIRCPDNMQAVFETKAGFLRVEQAIEAHLQAAVQAGAQLQTDVTVDTWHAQPDEVVVETSAGRLTARKLVVAAGAWSGQLLHDLDVSLNVRRNSLFWFAADDALHSLAAHMPVFLFEMPSGIYYGFPAIDARGVKVAEHGGGEPVVDPLQVDRSLWENEQRNLTQFLNQCLPQVTPQVTDHSVCLYTMTSDSHFLVDCHPQHDNVCFVAGLSGHGFKFAPVLGRSLAELALDGKTRLTTDFLSLAARQRADASAT